MPVHDHISFYSLLATMCTLCISFVNERAKNICARVVSHLILLQVFTIIVVLLAQECRRGQMVWLVWTLKVALFAFTILRFRRMLSFNVINMSVSIGILGLYCAYVNINKAYNCEVKNKTLFLTTVISCVVYSVLYQCIALCLS